MAILLKLLTISRERLLPTWRNIRQNVAKEKENWVKKVMSDCEKHYVCKQMKEKLERERERECKKMDGEHEPEQKELTC